LTGRTAAGAAGTPQAPCLRDVTSDGHPDVVEPQRRRLEGLELRQVLEATERRP
jgi:hypothetical protein